MSLSPRNSMLNVASSFMALGLFVVGCDSKEPTPLQETKITPAAAKAEPSTKPIIPIAQMVDWCPEHAMPESICVQCNESLAAGFKAKGDWCTEHNVPNSQDFAHHPELRAEFAAAYKAKYGKDAPADK